MTEIHVSARGVETVALGPFGAWIRQQIQAAGGEVRTLAIHLGVDDKAIARWANDDGDRRYADGVARIPLVRVDEVLTRAAVPLWEVYPDWLDDVEPTPTPIGPAARLNGPPAGYCPRCREQSLGYDDATCVWCETPLVIAMPRRTYKRRRDAKLTDRHVEMAYKLYRAGYSLRKLAAAMWERFGFASAHSCDVALHDAFKRQGFPLRNRIEATIAASTKHGLKRRNATPDELAEYKRRRRAAAGGYRPCAGVKTQAPGKGRPCQHNASPGSDYCASHDPAREEERRARLAEMRARIGEAA